MIDEFGGKETAKAMITLAIKLNTRVSEKLLLDFTGLPPNMLHHLLNELESENTIYHEEFGTLKLWRMCAAESNERQKSMDKFKVDDLVRVKPKANIPPKYHLEVGPICDIYPNTSHPYTILIHGVEHFFAEDELEKI